MAHFDASTADCFVFTFKEGLLATVAHDLALRVGRFEVDVDEAAGTLTARFDAASLRVEHALVGGRAAPRALGEADRRTIERNIAVDVLDVRRHPEVRFVASALPSLPPEDGAEARASGRLSLHGREREIALLVRRAGDRLLAEARLHQPDFGIRPYSAMLGTLRIKADVLVRVALPATPPPPA